MVLKAISCQLKRIKETIKSIEGICGIMQFSWTLKKYHVEFP